MPNEVESMVPGPLVPASKGKKLGYTENLYDKARQKMQSEINNEIVPESPGSDGQVLSLQNGAPAWVPAPEGTVVVDTEMSDSSTNPVQNKTIKDYTDGLIYDISAAHSNTAYESLAAALGTDGENVPSAKRKGGMSVKFVQSSDNKYVQYRYMEADATTAATFTNVANWQSSEPFQQRGTSETTPISQKAVTKWLNEIDLTTGIVINSNIGTVNQNSQYYIKILDIEIPAGETFKVRITGEGSIARFILLANSYYGSGDTIHDYCEFDTWYEYTAVHDIHSIGYQTANNPNATNVVFELQTEGLVQEVEQNTADINDIKAVTFNREFSGSITAWTLSSKISPTIPSGTMVKNDSSISLFLFKTTSDQDPYTSFTAGEIKVLTHDVNYFKGGSTAGNYHVIAYCELGKVEQVVAQNTIDIKNKVDINTGKNLLNLLDSDYTKNKYLLSNGTFYNNQNVDTSGYIPVKEDTKYHLSQQDDLPLGGSGAYMCFYDSSKNFISSLHMSRTDITTPAECSFIRISISHARLSEKPMVNEGDNRGIYYPYNIIGGYDEPALDPLNKEVLNITYKVDSMMGENAKRTEATLSDGDVISLTDFPYHCYKGMALSFYADVTTFDNLYIGKGYNQYRGEWIEIDNTNIVQKELGAHSMSEVYTVSINAHGLTIQQFIKVTLSCNYEGKCQVILQTLGGYYKIILDWGYQGNYSAFVKSVGSTLTNCKFNATSTDFKLPVWAFGDSYFGVTNQRWVGCLKNFGYFNYMYDALAGISAEPAYNDLIKCLNYGTPKYLLWCLGGNNYSDLSVAISYFENVIALCEEKNIEPILYTMPNMPERDYTVMNAWVRNSGKRFIDFEKAVGMPVYEQGVNHWYGAGTANDYLSSDGVHPSAIGAQAMATQVLVDFPEIMQYGLYKDDTTLDDSANDQ